MHTRAHVRSSLAALAAAVLIALSTPAAARPQSQGAARPQAQSAAHTTSRIIVQLRQGAEGAAPDAARPEATAARLTALAGADLDYVRAGDMPGMHIVALPDGAPAAEVEAAAARIAASPDVLYAEPDARLTIALTPTDPRYAAQMWHLKAVVDAGSGSSSTNFGANLPAAWDITTGSPNIATAIIDTGGLLTHEDLTGRTPAGNSGYDMITDVDTANDGGGRDADPSDPGDWIDASECGPGSPPEDSSWHGSHVAGTIGASANNGKGITGINWASKLLHMRALGKCGGFNSDIAAAIRWAAGLPVTGLPINPNPARVINMSLGGPGVCGVTLQSAITAAVSAGVVVVVAAGNEDEDLTAAPKQPASCSGVITVAATNQIGDRAYYSNYGSGVELAAPGGDGFVDSMVVSSINSGARGPVADAYDFYQGTSMATPHVAGVVSLMLSVNPSLTPAQVLEILQATVTPFPSYSGCDTSSCGAGILNAGKAVDEAARRVRTAGWQKAAQSVSEAAASASIPVRLSVPSVSSISVPFTVSGTAGSGDRTLSAGSVTIPAGATGANLTFPLTDDALVEGNETVIVTLGTPSGAPQPATLSGPTVHTLTIVDNEGVPAEPTITVEATGVAEAAEAVTLSFTVRRDGPDVAAGAGYIVRAITASGAEREVETGTASVASGAFTDEVTLVIPRRDLGVAVALEVALTTPTEGAVLGERVSERVELGAPKLFLPMLRK